MAQSDRAAAAAAAPASAALVWFRPGDLRLSDHEPLHSAALGAQLQQEGPLLLPFACLDEREFQPSGPLCLPRLGPHRLRCEPPPPAVAPLLLRLDVVVLKGF